MAEDSDNVKELVMNCKVSHICLGYNPRLSSYTVSPLSLEKGVVASKYKVDLM